MDGALVVGVLVEAAVDGFAGSCHGTKKVL
jgi:hypothetical protein